MVGYIGPFEGLEVGRRFCGQFSSGFDFGIGSALADDFREGVVHGDSEEASFDGGLVEDDRVFLVEPRVASDCNDGIFAGGKLDESLDDGNFGVG